jgi:GTP-binding protein EngB required for normal cell division
VTEPTTQQRLDGLSAAATALGPHVPEAFEARLDDLRRHADDRLGLGTDLTVVALAGSTGSGKSTLFNTLADLDLAEVGSRRPTTKETLACVFGDGDAGALLDWLGVPARRRLSHRSLLDEPESSDWAEGLVLLDLPDHDSLVSEHRVEVDRLVARVDVLVWVTDPVKYADAVLHEDYLTALRRHGAVVLVVLNQVDRLGVDDQQACLADLARLVGSDGLHDVDVVAVSASTGQGLAQVSNRVEAVVASRRAAAQRLAADVGLLADELLQAADLDLEAAVDPGAGAEHVLAALGSVLAIDDRTRDLAEKSSSRAERALAWPVGRSGTPAPLGERREHDSSAVGAAAPVEHVLREHVARVTAALPEAWGDDVRRDIEPSLPATAGRMLQSVRSAFDATPPEPPEWSVHRRNQWVAIALAAVGAVTAVLLLALVLAGSTVPVWAWLVPVGAVAGAVGVTVVLNRRAPALGQQWVEDVTASRRQHVADDLRVEVLTRVQAPLDAAAESAQRAREGLRQALI